MIDSVSPLPGPSTAADQRHLDKIRDVSEALEANFLAEMLKSAKFGETPESLGGGIGEDQFASFLRQAQADEMAAAGGIGLADAIFNALVARQGDGS